MTEFYIYLIILLLTNLLLLYKAEKYRRKMEKRIEKLDREFSWINDFSEELRTKYYTTILNDLYKEGR